MCGTLVTGPAIRLGKRVRKNEAACLVGLSDVKDWRLHDFCTSFPHVHRNERKAAKVLFQFCRESSARPLLVLASMVSISTVEAEAATTVPARCVYVYVWATARVAELVSAQVNTTNPQQQINLAQSAVQLAKDLDCSAKPMLKSIDCVIESVKNIGGQLPDKLTMLQCVETAAGQPFPKLKQ